MKNKEAKATNSLSPKQNKKHPCIITGVLYKNGCLIYTNVHLLCLAPVLCFIDSSNSIVFVLIHFPSRLILVRLGVVLFDHLLEYEAFLLRLKLSFLEFSLTLQYQ